jgi:sulfur-oxidizing protein SoxZ
MIMHPMENGFNVDTQGTTIPVHIISDFVCSYDGAEVFRVRLEPGLSANPYFSFYLTATRTGTVDFLWTDQDGTLTKASALLTVT